MLMINCDLGERGIAHREDDALIKYIDIANIGCGGHAGDKESVDYYVNLCKENNVKITAHISYPDKENFGRKIMQISHDALEKSFDEQMSLFDGIDVIKPHGALNNQLNVDEELAIFFINWCVQNEIKELLLNPFGIAAEYARKHGIKILAESFAERGYMLDINNNPMLIPRGQKNAEITVVADAVEQCQQLANGYITVDGKKIDFISETICIHSDSAISLELAQALAEVRS